MRTPVLFALFCLGASPAGAACLTDQQLAPLVTAWSEGKSPAYMFPADISMADANCTQDRLVALLGPAFGKVVGWKVAATNPLVQVAINGGPTRGAMLEKMLLAEGPPARESAISNLEADLILRVKDEGINNATTPLEILDHISDFVPFIEVPYMGRGLLGPTPPLSPALVTAENSVARQGIVGKAIPIKASWEWVVALGTMDVVLVQDGKEIARSDGAQSLGNPLYAVAWLIQDLKASGKKLNAGDLISTGSFSPLTPFKAGQTYTVRYEGLPIEAKIATISVTFN